MIDGSLRKIFHSRMKLGDWTPIETGMVSSGVPDSNCCYEGKEFWVEFKATNSSIVNLRPAQVGWIVRRQRHGGKCFIAVRQKRDALWLLHGNAARPLILKTKIEKLPDELILGLWLGGLKQWKWDEVWSKLLK